MKPSLDSEVSATLSRIWLDLPTACGHSDPKWVLSIEDKYNGARWERPSQDLRADTLESVDGTHKRRKAWENVQKPGVEILSFILFMKSLWKNNALQSWCGTLNSFYEWQLVKSGDISEEQMHNGLPLFLRVIVSKEAVYVCRKHMNPLAGPAAWYSLSVSCGNQVLVNLSAVSCTMDTQSSH